MEAKRLHRLAFWKASVWRPIGKIVTTFYGLLGLALTLREFLPEETQSKLNLQQVLGLLPEWRWQSWVLLFLVPAIFVAMEGAYRVYKREATTLHNEINSLTAELANQNEKPVIAFSVKDAFVLPFPGEARCFLHVSLHNETNIPCSNPNDYHVSLKIAGKEYQEGAFLHLQSYKLEHYKMAEIFDGGEVEETLYSEKLTDIRTQSGNLVKGEPMEGWIGFGIHYVPKWQALREYTGPHQEDLYVPEVGATMPFTIDDFHLVHSIKSVEELRITVTDAYKQEWTASLTGPFVKRGKRIAPPPPPQDWD